MVYAIEQLPSSWTHGQFRDVYGPIPVIVWINPVDADGLGVKSGDDVSLFNKLGAITIEAIITENPRDSCSR